MRLSGKDMDRILVVDDEKEIVKLLKAYLERAGYQVVTADDGRLALAKFRAEHPDLMILDLMLPGLDGIEVCKAVRRESDIPIIMLTAKVEESDKILGLELGADDYVTKPFSPREVVARVNAVLRRTKGQREEEVLRVGGIEMYPQKHAVYLDGKELSLTPTEFDLLHVFMKSPGRVFTRLQLLEKVQGYAYDGYERTIDAHIKNLRKHLGDSSRNPRYILTVHGVGYKMAEE